LAVREGTRERLNEWDGRVSAGPGIIKICGLREPEHARVAVEAGANWLGFIFAPARRRVSPEVARSCVAAARAVVGSRGLVAVGVFVDASAAEINAVADAANLDLVQLHGEEPVEMLSSVTRPIVKGMRSGNGASLEEVAARIARYEDGRNSPMAYLIDGYSAHGAGGTGVRADWSIAAQLARRYRVLLAGGLDPVNVSEAVRTVQPRGVDVSSGVETGGRKDAVKISDFVRAARSALDATIGLPLDHAV
jgi:phosphoribosylanthranilate isomerase